MLREFTRLLAGSVLFAFAVDESTAPDSDATFTNVSASAGLTRPHPAYGNPTWIDVDGDGHLDMFVINHQETPSLLRNSGNGTFTDIAAISGIAPDGDRHGVAWGDFDNDGHPDLFITLGARRGANVGGKTDQLYRNDGRGRFVDVTAAAGVSNAFGRGRAATWVDVNGDGHLDLFVKNQSTPNVLYLNNGNGTFTDVAVAAGIADIPGHSAAWADYDGDGLPDLFVTGSTDQLWKNNGDGTFRNVTAAAGLAARRGGQGVAWGDYNNDGHLDLFVARGYNDVTDGLRWSGSEVRFSDDRRGEEAGLDIVTTGGTLTFDLYLRGCRNPKKVFIGSASTSPASLPVRGDTGMATGKPSYVVGHSEGFFIWKSAEGWHLRWNSDETGTAYAYGKITTDGVFISARGVNFGRTPPRFVSTLYRNNGDGTFTDVSVAAGVASRHNNRGAVWGDYNNDGYLDLYVVNAGTFEAKGPNTLYRNNGDGTFTDVTRVAGVVANVDGRGSGAAWGDFDGDGFLDLYVTNGWGERILSRHEGKRCLAWGPHLLYKNNGNGQSWLKVTLVGTVGNRDGIGAKVLVETGGLTQFREHMGSGGGHFSSQGGGPLHFGLAGAAVVDTLTVRWRSGITQILRDIPINQSITVVEAAR